MITSQSDWELMGASLAEAEQAFSEGEVPIGAVIVKEGEIIARAHNRRETERDPTAHAEILAIRAAAQCLGTWRLTGTTMYVTIEPCPMCAGALVWARVSRLVYGAADLKAGAVHSLMNIVQDERLNHALEVRAGVREDECSRLMKDFFRRLRGRRKELER